jgi:quinoprotein glucose dehydrogenase
MADEGRSGMGRGFTRRSLCATGIAGVLAAGAVVQARAQPRARGVARAGLPTTANGEWTTYSGDLSSHRYSPLSQITAENFNNLEVAWRFGTSSLGPAPEFNLESTPLMVGGVLYFTGGTRRAAVALDAATGELLWKYNIDEGRRRGPRTVSGRGLTYWSDGQDAKIIYVTPGYQMISLDAITGQPTPSFGVNGVVDLRKELDQPDINLDTADIGLASAPIVVGDVIVVGSSHLPSTSVRRGNLKGAIRGYDIRTGKRLWIFKTIPQKGEPGNETWLNGSEVYTGNAGSWAQMSADPELGLVYVGVELPTGDWYGGARPGAGLFGESIVALDVKTGERRWHYQTVHHGLWDRDIPCASILADLNVDGRTVKALIQPVKHSWLFVLDRATGKPVWPIPERRVPKGDVIGEWYSPTQPHVTKPPAFDVQGVSIDDLIDFTPALRAEATAFVSNYRIGPLFTPPSMSKWPKPLGSLVAPMSDGSAQWPGGAIDPETNIVYIYSNSTYGFLGMVETPQGENPVNNGMATAPGSPPGQGRPRLTIQGMPLLKPPYGRITALDMNRGEILWQKAHGETPDEVRNNPALKGLTIPRTGSMGKVGTLVTKTLVIAGDGTAITEANGVKAAWLRAYDKQTGAEVGAVKMGSRVTGSPMTYQVGGRQYVAVPIGGPGYPSEMIAFRVKA